jgi:RNA polymerase sigma-70 factor (ECF subfamily)
VEQKGFVEQLKRCIELLPAKMKQVFTLRTVEEVPTSEVCEVMNISENNLWVILYRARMQLRSCLDTNWFRAR